MKENVSFIPRGNKVLVRAEFEVSTLNILNDEVINNIPAKSYTVVAVSDKVIDLHVGDKIKLENGAIPTLISMPNDNQTLRAKQTIHREGKGIAGVGTVKFHEYLLVDEYAIVGIWKESSESVN